MKVGATSDIHGILLQIADEFDLFVIAGDISPLKIQGNMPLMEEWLFNDFSNWILSIPAETVVMTPGNHDFWFEKNKGSQKIKNLEHRCEGKLKILINEYFEIWDHTIDVPKLIKIWGTPYCHIFGQWPFMRGEESLEKHFAKIPKDLDILISHDPPFGVTEVDLIMHGGLYKGHVGNFELQKRIEEVKPRWVICGHIHTGQHYPQVYGDTNYVNVSLLNESYKQYFDIFKFNI